MLKIRLKRQKIKTETFTIIPDPQTQVASPQNKADTQLSPLEALPPPLASLVYTYLSLIDLIQLSSASRTLHQEPLPWSLFLNALAMEMKKLPGYKEPEEENEASDAEEEEEREIHDTQSSPATEAGSDEKYLPAEKEYKNSPFPPHITRNVFENGFVHAVASGRLQLPKDVTPLALLQHLFFTVVKKISPFERGRLYELPIAPAIFDHGPFNILSKNTLTEEEAALFFLRKQDKVHLLRHIDAAYKNKKGKGKASFAQRAYWLIIHNATEQLRALVEDKKYAAKGIPKTISHKRQSALFTAARYNRVQAIEILAQLDNNLVNEKHGKSLSFSPLHMAVHLTHKEAVECLLAQKNIEVNYAARWIDTPTPLFSALKQQNLYIVSLLLKHKANPNLGRQQEHAPYITPLHFVVGLMIAEHLAPEEVKNHGLMLQKHTTPALLLQLLELLLTYKADPLKTGREDINSRSKKKEEKTPLALLGNHHPEAAALLKTAEETQKTENTRKREESRIARMAYEEELRKAEQERPHLATEIPPLEPIPTPCLPQCFAPMPVCSATAPLQQSPFTAPSHFFGGVKQLSPPPLRARNSSPTPLPHSCSLSPFFGEDNNMMVNKNKMPLLGNPSIKIEFGL